MNFNSTFSNPSFKGRREDLKNIKSLSDNNMPILANKKELILSSIDNVGKNADKEDIEMLMGTVETMKYGIKNNSEFAKALGGADGTKENTDWDGILQATIKTAIDQTDGEDKQDLEARFQKIFGEEKPLTEQEKNLLQLRSDILASKELTNVLDDPDKTFEAARIRENLDYFVASSEINTDDKEKCMGLMKHFLSDDYEIHPQLKEHKVQAFSEMLNDLIVKRPDEDAYTIKDVSQKQTGMCAAISIARKTISYEDKVRAMEIMMAELDNKPTMEVYDRTAIGTGKKVQVEKAHVDFTDGMKKGYRIVDTGTHQWMNAANLVGDGRVSIAHYQAFDPENYEIFRDAKWLNDLPEDYQPQQNWLRYLGKEQGAVQKAMKRNNDIVRVQHEVGEFKKQYETTVVKADSEIRNTISKLSPSISDLKATTLTRQLLKADKLENSEFKLIAGEPKEAKMNKLAAFMKSELPDVSAATIDENIEKISNLRDLSISANVSLDKLKSHSNPKAIFAYNKNLFNAAAHHRRSVQAELNIPERLSAYEKALNVSGRENFVQDSAQKILNNLSSNAVIAKAAESFGVDNNTDAVKLAVENALTTTEVTIPAQLDDALNQMGMGDRVRVITEFINDAENKIKAGDNEALQTFADNIHIKPEASLVLKKLESVKASLADAPSNKQIANAVNVLGYNNQIEMTADMYKTFADAVDNGLVSKEQLSAMFGQNAEEKIAVIGKNIKFASDKQAQIERQFNIPSRKDIVLNMLEATGEILPEKTLQEMQEKYDKVAEAKAESDSRIVDPSVKKPKVPDSVYKFTPAEKQIYAQIESKIPSMRQYAKTNYKAMNKELAPQLKELYAEAGRLDGHLWVSGEGESGLYDNQSIRLLEMITGKHYHNEEDIDKVVAHIKKGEGSGTSSTNVSHTSYSGHAQYVEEVSQVAVIDPKTKETVMKDVLWHDNTWGRAEDEGVWTDEKGVQRTDYGNGYGGPEGYVFNKHLLTGTFVEDQKYTPGILPDGKKFDLWRSTRISGVNSDASEKLDKVMTEIVQLGSSDAKLAQYEKMLKTSPSVDFAMIDNLNAMVGQADNIMLKKLDNSDIKTQEDIDNLKDKSLKFLLEKTAVQMSSPSEKFSDYVVENVMNSDSLADIKNNLPKIHKEVIGSVFLKGKNAVAEVVEYAQNDLLAQFDAAFAGVEPPENLKEIYDGLSDIAPEKLDGTIANLKQVMIKNANEKISEGISDKKIVKQLSQGIADVISNAIDNELSIKSVEDLQANSDMAEVIIKYADKKFNTSSDADLNKALQKIQNMTNDEFNEFMADATNTDLGIKNVDALSVAKQINAQKSVATDAFSYNAQVQIFKENRPDSNAPEWIYRTLNMNLSPLNNTSQIREIVKSRNDIKAAFPEAEIMSEEEVNNVVAETLAFVEESVENIRNASNKGEAVAEMNMEINGYVSANVAEKYQSKALGLINSYIKALRNNSTDADKIKNSAQSVMAQGHITKHTNELLKSYIKEVQSKNPDENKLLQLRAYMQKGLQISEIANVEYQLIDNGSNAIEGMTRQTFDKYPLVSKDGETIALDSDEGIRFLISKLVNPDNGSSALQVFFTQTGLSEKAVDVIANSFKLEILPESCEEIGNQLIKTYSDINSLNNSFASFNENNSISYSSYKDAVKHYLQTLDKDYAEKSAEDRKVYNIYRTYLQKTQNSDAVNSLSPDMISPMLAKVHAMGIQFIQSKTVDGTNELNYVSETLRNNLDAMSALKLPKNSEKAEIKAEFLKEAEEAYAKIEELINKINNSINS